MENFRVMDIKYYPSIFNDVIGPVMRGPSSSHTAATHRIGQIIRQLRNSDLKKVVVKFDRSGSLPTTYLGQGTAMGLAGGLLGIEMTDPEIINYDKHLKESSFTIEYRITDLKCKHPNAYLMDVEYKERENFQILAVSTGGGMFEIIELNGFKVSIKGGFFENLFVCKDIPEKEQFEIERYIKENFPECMFQSTKSENGKFLVNIKSLHSLKYKFDKSSGLKKHIIWKSEITPVLPVPSNFGKELPFKSVKEMLVLGKEENLSLSELAVRYEAARSDSNGDSVLKKMEEIVIVIRNSINKGLSGTFYSDRILGSQSFLIERAEKKGLIDRSVNNKIIAYTSALMEVKSSVGLIVATPTAGSCGVVGGALFGSVEKLDYDPGKMVRAFMAAGIAGVFIADKYTFSAEEGGCQVETGSGAAMAAAGLVELNGGTAEQAVAAASMALQNQLGQICDPVAVRVEVPCLGKNILAATNAYNSYIMAMSGFDPVIPYDEVIDAMKSVGESLPSSLCCTGLGGLAQTPTGKKLDEQFNIN